MAILSLSSSPKLNFFINNPTATATAAAGVANFSIQLSIFSKALTSLFTNLGYAEQEKEEKEKKKIITDSKEFFNELTDIEIFYIAETLENGGGLSDLFEDYEFKGTTEYEIEDMVLEYSEAYPEKYYEYLSTGGY